MSQSSYLSTILVLQALKGLQESGQHLKKATEEVLLAAQTVTSTASNIALEMKLDKEFPVLYQCLETGEKFLQKWSSGLNKEDPFQSVDFEQELSVSDPVSHSTSSTATKTGKSHSKNKQSRRGK